MPTTCRTAKTITVIEPGSRFTVVQPNKGRTYVKLYDPLVYDSDRLYLRVPRIVSDGSSVPAPLWGVLVNETPLSLLEVGVIHDYLYRIPDEDHGHPAIRLDGVWQSPTRVQADVIYKGIVEERGSWMDARSAYYALRVAGGPSWQQKPVEWTGQ